MADEPKVIALADLDAQIISRAGIDPNSVTTGGAYRDGKGGEWQVGSGPPVGAHEQVYRIKAMFREDDGERHMYAVPISAMPDGKPAPLLRYVLNDDLFVEQFPSLELFVAEIAYALQRQAARAAPLFEPKAIACAACSTEHPICAACGQPEDLEECAGFEMPEPPSPPLA